MNSRERRDVEVGCREESRDTVFGSKTKVDTTSPEWREERKIEEKKKREREEGGGGRECEGEIRKEKGRGRERERERERERKRKRKREVGEAGEGRERGSYWYLFSPVPPSGILFSAYVPLKYYRKGLVLYFSLLCAGDGVAFECFTSESGELCVCVCVCVCVFVCVSV